ADFKAVADNMDKELYDLGIQTGALEERIDELFAAKNDMVDKIQNMASDYKRLQEKVADLEDRSHNNIRVCGVQEPIQTN
ncbi:Hypothetical predicted protein, partial [Pelobates cultripes]